MSEETTKKLSRLDLLSMAAGQIIGVGIMTMTGIAIGFTGRSVNIAYIAAGILTLISLIPQIYIGGTANFYGGQYSQIAVLSGQRMAGIYMYIQLFSALAISMYALSFADYFLSLFPGVNAKLLCVVMLSVLYGLHFFGVKQAARLQNILCVILAAAIAAYIVLGIGHVQPDYFTNGFMTKGAGGFIIASVYLTFAAGGAQYVVNYSSVSENPTKDIPFAMTASTLGVVAIYAIMATVSAGVLPVEQVANQPLSVSAAVFMPKTIYTFFVVGGAMFALLTTLNFNIGMIVFPVSRASMDGWLPELWKKSAFHVSDGKLKAVCVVSMAIALLSVVILLVSTSMEQIIGNVVILLISVTASLIVNKRVHLSPSYEEV